MQGLSKLERAGNPASGGAWHGCTSVEAAGSGALGAQFTCFTGTKVQIMAQKTLIVRVQAACSASRICSFVPVYSLYWYKSTHTDAEDAG
jgi:hypothetical protein